MRVDAQVDLEAEGLQRPHAALGDTVAARLVGRGLDAELRADLVRERANLRGLQWTRQIAREAVARADGLVVRRRDPRMQVRADRAAIARDILGQRRVAV